MYLLFVIVGLVIGGFIGDWDSGSIAMGAMLGLVIAFVMKYLIKFFNHVSKSSGGGSSSSVFDGCILGHILMGLLQGLSD